MKHIAEISEIYGTVEVLGMDIPIVGDAEIIYVDGSFSHEFGIERIGSWEVQKVTDVVVDGYVRDSVVEDLHSLGYTKHNRRFKKNMRRLVSLIDRVVTGLDYNAFSESEIENAIASADTDRDE